MALVSVLLVTVVMLALAAAFFAAHRSDLALLTSSTYREQTKNACLSVADILQYKLQNDRTFGSGAFSRETKEELFPLDSSEPVLEFRYTGDGFEPEKNLISGTLPLSEVEFEIRLVNNLASNAITERLTYNPSAPPRTARAWITARRKSVVSHIEVIFKQSPFTTASITSNGSIDVQLKEGDGYWHLGAMQQSGNKVRASGNIKGPEVWSKTGAAVRFTPPPGMERKLRPPYGTMQARTLQMQVDGRHTFLQPGSTETLESEATIQGVLSSGGGEVRIPDLDPDNLQGASRKVHFPHSQLTFETVDDGKDGPVHKLMSGSQELARYNPENYSGKRTFQWEDPTGQTAATFDLENRVMAVNPDIELQVDTNFTLSGRTKGQASDPLQPTLVLGNSERGASLKATSIDIDGSVGGFGAIKSSGDLKVAAKSALSTTPDFGIALHAKGDVNLNPPGANSNDGLAVDFEAFEQATSSVKDNATLDRWGYLGDRQMASEAASFKNRSLASSGGKAQFQPLWDGLTSEFPADQRAIDYRDSLLKEAVAEVTVDDPDWVESPAQPTPSPVVVTPAEPAGPGIKVDNYVRLREYLRSVKKGAPDASWLEAPSTEMKDQRAADVTNLVKNQISSYQLTAGQQTKEIDGQPVLSWKPLTGFFGGSNPYKAKYAPDMLFRGLVYTEGNFTFNANKQGIYIEGALVATRDVKILEASGAQFVYNSDLLQNLFAPEQNDLSIPLERAYWAYF